MENNYFEALDWKNSIPKKIKLSHDGCDYDFGFSITAIDSFLGRIYMEKSGTLIYVIHIPDKYKYSHDSASSWHFIYTPNTLYIAHY